MKVIGLAFALMLSINTMAQLQFTNTNNKAKLSAANGDWLFESYIKGHVLKITHQPINYNTNQNISDAVITKPLKTVATFTDNSLNINDDFKIEIINNDIVINGKPMMIGCVEDDGCRGFKFGLKPDEKITGGGSRALPLNRRGYKFNLYNSPWYSYNEGADNLNYSVPFFMSSNGYGLFFDNPSKGWVDIGKKDGNVFEYGAVSGELSVYVILGRDYKEILLNYNKLTGTQPLPPRWAMGNLMSRFGYTSEVEVKDILAKMKAENIPVDAVIFDLFWFGDSIKQTMGNLDWMNKQAWPEPKKMISDFKKDGINTILISEPFVVNASRTFTESEKYHAVDSAGHPFLISDFYFGPAGLIDIFRKDAQSWFWKQHKKQMGIGVEAWWGDLGEPERHPSNLYHNLKDKGFSRLFASDEVHNIYGHTWTKMLYDSFAKNYPNKRLFSLNRSGFAGSQRYSIFPWSGDVERSWSGLRAQLPVMLGMSMSGVPYMHSDAGGFAGGEGDNELYVRWLQYAAFTPIFRPHGTALYDKDPHAFSFPSEAALIAEPYKEYAKDAITLRYAMLPYNYTLAYLQATQGKPLARPMFYNYPNDSEAYKADQQYMWGDDIMVLPVINKADSVKKFYAPVSKWYEIYTHKMYEGNEWHEINVDLTHIPFLLREGSFVTMQNSTIKNTANFTGNNLRIAHVISDKPAVAQVYFDDGISKDAIKTEKYEMLNIAATINKSERDITIFSTGGFKGMPATRNISFVIVGYEEKPGYVIIDGKKIAVKTGGGMVDITKTVYWDEATKVLSIPIKFVKKSLIKIL